MLVIFTGISRLIGGEVSKQGWRPRAFMEKKEPLTSSTRGSTPSVTIYQALGKGFECCFAACVVDVWGKGEYVGLNVNVAIGGLAGGTLMKKKAEERLLC